MFFSIDATPESGRYGRLVNHSKVQTLFFVLLVVFTMGENNYFNKTKYFRLHLTDEVSSERPKGDLRMT